MIIDVFPELTKRFYPIKSSLSFVSKGVSGVRRQIIRLPCRVLWLITEWKVQGLQGLLSLLSFSTLPFSSVFFSSLTFYSLLFSYLPVSPLLASIASLIDNPPLVHPLLRLIVRIKLLCFPQKVRCFGVRLTQGVFGGYFATEDTSQTTYC